MEPKGRDTKLKATRARTGCLTCRRRRKKCDERKPRCAGCLRNHLSCEWPAALLLPGRQERIPIRQSNCKAGVKSDERRAQPDLPRKEGDAESSSASEAGSTSSKAPPWMRKRGGLDQISLNASLRAVPGWHEVVLLLVPLTSIHTGRLAIKHVNPVAAMSQYIMTPDTERRSYLFEIPSLLGHNDALHSAFECVVAAFNELCQTTSQLADSPSSVSLYAKALANIRSEINDPEKSTSAETLCAVALLSIFEYLRKDTEQAWIQHAGGAARLIKERGPRRFTTDFEKTLFMSQVGIVLTETFFKQEACYLEQDEWVETLRSTISPNELYSDRSEMTVSLYETMVPFSRIFQDCGDLITAPAAGDEERHESLIQRVRQLLKHSRRWGERYFGDVSAEEEEAGADRHGKPLPGGPRRLENFFTHRGVAVACMRVLIALDHGRGRELEEQVQQMAESTMRVVSGRQSSVRAGNVSLSIANFEGILRTREEWDASITAAEESFDGRPLLVGPEQYQRYLQYLGFR